MKKILFLIHDLGQGGAEKVLVNLVNNMDHSKFDITVMTLFDCGENRRFLRANVRYKTWCPKMIPGNSHLMKLFRPQILHELIVREHYDVEVAYLEGPSARVISGCTSPDTKLVCWIHIELHSAKAVAASFRSIEEARHCYGKFDKIISVSQTVEDAFRKSLRVKSSYGVLYNTNESEKILELARQPVNVQMEEQQVKLIGIGKLLKSKGFDRVLRIIKRLVEEDYSVHLYILGEGPEHASLQNYICQNGLENNATLLGYELNPYKYLAKCDLFVCASYAEGFSTAATEALIVGTPVCTVEVSGMREMLGEDSQYGLIVPNDEEALYQGIKSLLDQPERLAEYRRKAAVRGKTFSTHETVEAVQEMLTQLVSEKSEE
ncbi:MAG: glycosyltransferase [Gemmiger sp.]|uniref:glycosyltransferase n=1 Tax=Gemmiger sp. TaxID=2049027 RepID=UPI002E7870BC|nr:glycosyltransferase [Gemmiger sp.]MEE0799897.1 glycosyltransferase [Gemmiger sp.]